MSKTNKPVIYLQKASLNFNYNCIPNVCIAKKNNLPSRSGLKYSDKNRFDFKESNKGNKNLTREQSLGIYNKNDGVEEYKREFERNKESKILSMYRSYK